MPLIECPDCGKKISDQAAVCIGCGRPLNPASQGNAPSTTDKPKPTRPPGATRKTLIWTIIALILMILPAGAISFIIDGAVGETQLRQEAEKIAGQYGSYDSQSVNTIKESLKKIQDVNNEETGSSYYTSEGRIAFYLVWLGGTILLGLVIWIRTKKMSL